MLSCVHVQRLLVQRLKHPSPQTITPGPSKLPSLGKELGKTAKSFQTAAKEFEKELKTGAEEAEAEAKKDE